MNERVAICRDKDDPSVRDYRTIFRGIPLTRLTIAIYTSFDMRTIVR